MKGDPFSLFAGDLRIGQKQSGRGDKAAARTPSCSKASAIKMVEILMDMGLLARERYGKIYLTDAGFLTTEELIRCVELIRRVTAKMGAQR